MTNYFHFIMKLASCKIKSKYCIFIYSQHKFSVRLETLSKAGFFISFEINEGRGKLSANFCFNKALIIKLGQYIDYL